MEMYKQIKIDTIVAMKAKDNEKRDILRVVTGEFDRERSKLGRDVNNVEALKILKKMHGNAEELGNEKEAEILATYLPKMLGPKEILIIVDNIIKFNDYKGIVDMGKVMGQLKNVSEAPLIDMQTASQITKELLNG